MLYLKITVKTNLFKKFEVLH